MRRPDAPAFRSLDQLTGDVSERPSRFVQALSEADEFIKDLDRVRELETRLQEVEAERDEWRGFALGLLDVVTGVS